MSSQDWKDIVWLLSQDKVIDFHQSGDGTTDGKVMYYFDTFRRMTYNALLKMSSIFPSMHFEIIFHCGIGWYRGFLSLQNGNEVSHRFLSSHNYHICKNQKEYTAFLLEMRKEKSKYIINDSEQENAHGFDNLYDLVGDVIRMPEVKNIESSEELAFKERLDNLIRKRLLVPKKRFTTDDFGIVLLEPNEIDWDAKSVHVEVQYETVNISDKKRIVGINVIDDSICDGE